MARLIQSKIKEPLVDAILFGSLQNGGSVVVDAERRRAEAKFKLCVPSA